MTYHNSNIPDTNDVRKALDTAFRFLTYRIRTESEIRRRLQNRYTNSVIDSVVEKLLEQKYLDDSKFATEWRDSRTKHKPRSKSLLRQELYRLGVSDTISLNTLNDIDDEDMAHKATERLAERLISRDTNKQDFTKKLSGHLQRRGFSYQVINRTLNRLTQKFYPSTSDNKYALD
jgi:regulatory protein